MSQTCEIRILNEGTQEFVCLTSFAWDFSGWMVENHYTDKGHTATAAAVQGCNPDLGHIK